MKKLIFILVVLFGFSMQAQELKGYKLGSKYTGKVTNHMGIKKNVTLGGIKGDLVFGVLNDGRIAQIAFIPFKRVYNSDVETLKKGLENKYNIKLSKTESDIGESEEDRDYMYLKNNFSVFLSVDNNRYMSPGNKVVVMVVNVALYDKLQDEKQEVYNDDF